MPHVSGETGGWVGQGSSDNLFEVGHAPRKPTKVPHRTQSEQLSCRP